ncbi:hypothetical protein ABK040_013410 [Willaertia magna]
MFLQQGSLSISGTTTSYIPLTVTSSKTSSTVNTTSTVNTLASDNSNSLSFYNLRRLHRNEPIYSNAKCSYSQCMKKKILRETSDNKNCIQNYLLENAVHVTTSEEEGKKKVIRYMGHEVVETGEKVEKEMIFNSEHNARLHYDENKRASRDITENDGGSIYFRNANEAAAFFQEKMEEKKKEREERMKKLDKEMKKRVKERQNSMFLEKQREVEKLKKEKERKQELKKKMWSYGSKVNEENMKSLNNSVVGSRSSTCGSTKPYGKRNNNNFSQEEDEQSSVHLSQQKSDIVENNQSQLSTELNQKSNSSKTSQSINTSSNERMSMWKTEEAPTIEDHLEEAEIVDSDSTSTTTTLEPFNSLAATKQTVSAFNNFARRNLTHNTTMFPKELYSQYERGADIKDNVIIIQAPSFTVYLDDDKIQSKPSLINKPNYIPLNNNDQSIEEEANSEYEISSIPESTSSSNITVQSYVPNLTKEQKKKQYREEKRYLKQLNKQFIETIKQSNIDLPRLCNCDIDNLDTNAQHSNNCYYFQNKMDYAKDLSSLLHSYGY